MTDEPNQTDADDTDETSDDPIEGATSQGAATAPNPVAGGDDEPDEDVGAGDEPSVPSPSDAGVDEAEADSDDTPDVEEGADSGLDEESSEAESLAEDTSEPGLDEESSEAESLAEDTSEPGLDEESSEAESLAEDTSEPGLDEESSEVEAAEADEEDADEEEPDESLDLPEYTDLREQGADWLAGLFERMHLSAEADIHDEDGQPRVDISGPDADRLLGVGKLGPKAIEGIETLMQSVFSEDDDASGVYLDVGNKRAERKEMLQRVAADLADRAVDLHKTVTVSGLNSTERRIIHRRLRDYDGVDTESVGDGIFRRLKIEPTN